MRSRHKILLIALGFALLALLVVALMPAPVPVSVGEAQRGYFAEVVEDEGRAWLRDPYTVSAPIHGYLRRVMLEPGDRVSVGDLVFELEAMPSPGLDLRAREQAREAVSAASARLELAEAERDIQRTRRQVVEAQYHRQVELHEQGFISTEAMERSRGERNAARAAERAAQHAVEVAHFELQAARITLAIADGERTPETQPRLGVRAPIAGTVLYRHRCCEGPIGAGEPVLEIGDLATLEVRMDLLSMDAVRVRPGMRVVLERWGGRDVLEGEVRRVEPRGFERISALGVEERRVPVLVSILTPREQWEALGVGYRVEGRIVLWEAEDVLQIPTSALFRDGERWAVFVVLNGRAERRVVELGRRNALGSEILQGLSPGEQVITHPAEHIQHGARVRPQRR